jgi:hypothetical protein
MFVPYFPGGFWLLRVPNHHNTQVVVKYMMVFTIRSWTRIASAVANDTPAMMVRAST